MVLKNASILVVDDDTDILTAVRLLLKTETAEVVTEKILKTYEASCRKDPLT